MDLSLITTPTAYKKESPKLSVFRVRFSSQVNLYVIKNQ